MGYWTTKLPNGVYDNSRIKLNESEQDNAIALPVRPWSYYNNTSTMVQGWYLNILISQSLSGHTTPVECVCFGHSEDLVCAGSQTGALKIWDLEAAKLLRTFTGHKGAIKCMDFHPYGDYLTTGSCDSNVKLWDTRKKGCIVTYSSHRLAVNSLQFSPDGQWIASACDDGKETSQNNIECHV